MKINIFVRHCKFSANSANKVRPSYFTREGCFRNLLHTVDKDCKINVSFDGTLSGSGHFLENPEYAEKFTLYEKMGGNDAASFLNAIEYAHSSSIKDGEVIYFVEDDFLHNVGWPSIMREGFHNLAVDYVTLYDHKDKYFFPMYAELMTKLVVTKSTHWQSIPNTTNTYACLAKTFRRDYEIHKRFCDLTRGLTRDFDKFAYLGELGKSLVNCIPGYSTHCETEFMSPVIDWEIVFKKTT